MGDKKKANTRKVLIGFSFIAAIVIFIWGYNFLRSKNLFKQDTTYYGSYTKVNGLIKANPIVINGLRIGQVKDIYFNPNMSGDIIVVMDLSTNFPIPKNSIAHIFSSDLMGSKAIEIKLGNSSDLLQEGDTLRTSIEGGLMEEVNASVQPIKAKAENLLASIDTLVIAFQSIFNKSARDNLKQSFADIEQTFANLQNTTSNLDTLVVTESTTISSILSNIDSIALTLKNNRHSFQNIIQNFEVISDSLAESEIPATFDRLNSTLAEMESIIAKINEGQGTLGMLVTQDSLYNELNRSAVALDSLLNDVRKNPKRYVKFSLF
jgi:phospholipid/cholesterol/gamma-HCH transport system substrate-binding protein